jgi:hypothetical protein
MLTLVACATAVGCSLSSDYASEPSAQQEVAGPKGSSVDAGSGGGGGGNGGGGNEGGTLIAPDPDAGNIVQSTFCMQDAGGQLLACDDFDQSTTLAANWARDEQGAGQIGLDSKDAKSAPSSILASIPAHTTNFMYHDIGLQTGVGSGAFSLEFDVFVTVDLATTGANIANNYACIAQISTDQDAYTSLCIGKTEAAGYMNTFSSTGTLTTTKIPMTANLQLDGWHHVRIAYAFAQTGSMTIQIDGNKLASFTGRTMNPKKPAVQYVYPEIGLETDGQWGATTARIDNMRLTQL